MIERPIESSRPLSSLPPAHASEGPRPLKMKDLCDATGLPRQAIHFYIQQGLVPPGAKTGRNMAYYGEEHIQRLKLIKKLQHERFLPLKAIRALLDDQESQFSQVQRSLLLEVKQRFTTSLLARPDAPDVAVDADEACARHGIERSDLDRMLEIGILGARVDEAGRTAIAHDDVWVLSAWGEIQKLGYAKELGFRVDDIQILLEVVQDLFNREALLLASRMDRLPPERAAEMIERALPIIHSFLTGFHVAKIRNFFASIE
ncbi:MAG: MerR family transcriptional regulator [Sandaracinaceae bacterium]|jgi:DNA-binding transcriptional MerR regulator|nr:MerR family transcriptional regulator [Sandaracinaceae bacterium]